MNRPSLAALRSPLALVLVVATLASIGIGWSLSLDGDAREAVEARHAALAAAQARQRQGQHEARMIAQHLDAYQSLVARGFVGAENRLAWIEAVQLANREAGLYGLTYTLSPREAAPAARAEGLPLQQTRMTVKLPLLVETDLPRFLAAVRARAPGIVRVDRCTLTRPLEPAVLSAQPALEAECDLVWYTLTSKGDRA